MDITCRSENGILTVALSGALDTNTAPELTRALEGALEGMAGLILDLNEVDYLSSAGIRAILCARKDVTAVGGSLRLIGVQPVVYKVLEITRLTDSLEIERA